MPPPSYVNWVRRAAGEPAIETVETPLYSDGWLTGHWRAEGSPYQVINLIDIEESAFRPVAVLRMDDHRPIYGRPPEIKTDVTSYHGGSLEDEIAALASLVCGIRLKAGGISRHFRPDGDPLGDPVGYNRQATPNFPAVAHRLIPQCHQHVPLSLLDGLMVLPKLNEENASALVKAARMFQKGLWISDADPELSWLLIVSAVEVAANRWREAAQDPVDRLTTSRPKLRDILMQAGGQDLLALVAGEIAPYMGATRKFLDFLLEFLPEPPAIRPVESCRLSWDTKELTETLRQVYDYRSRALHGGTPFPIPMCISPMAIRVDGIPSEVPIGLAVSYGEGTWERKDIRVHLHTFVHIARGALVRWMTTLT